LGDQFLVGVEAIENAERGEGHQCRYRNENGDGAAKA
jgi:hypothetical protein